MTTIEIILLTLLYEKDRYGYEIESIISERNMRKWTKIGFSSIYNSLNNLEKKQWISWRLEEEFGSPPRKIYGIKAALRPKVKEIVKNLLQNPERVYSEFSIGLAFSNFLSKEEVRECLLKYRASLVERKYVILQTYDEQAIVQAELHVQALFTHPLKLIDAEIEWIDGLINNMKEQQE